MEEKLPGLLSDDDKRAIIAFSKSEHYKTLNRLIDYEDAINDADLRSIKKSNDEIRFLQGCLAYGAALKATIENVAKADHGN